MTGEILGSEDDTAAEFLRAATVDTFRPHVGTTFRLTSSGDSAVLLELVDAVGGSFPEPGDGVRRSFALTFRGPSDTLLAQQMYTLEHDSLGSFPLFLVPIEPDAAGPRYEAVFG